RLEHLHARDSACRWRSTADGQSTERTFNWIRQTDLIIPQVVERDVSSASHQLVCDLPRQVTCIEIAGTITCELLEAIRHRWIGPVIAGLFDTSVDATPQACGVRRVL